MTTETKTATVDADRYESPLPQSRFVSSRYLPRRSLGYAQSASITWATQWCRSSSATADRRCDVACATPTRRAADG